MYDLATRKRALALIAQGRSLNSVSKETGISRWSLRSWQQRLHPAPSRGTACCRCSAPAGVPEDTAAYSYLLGLYLGDGCISRLARTYFLRIACADAWPGLIVDCERAVKAVCPENGVFRVQREGCVNVTAYNKHWPCLLPQHGPGRKHTRTIALEPWQRAIVDCERAVKAGVEWKSTRHRCGGYNISVARRAAVALMDAHVGPKH